MALPHTVAAAVIISDCIDENARVRQQCRFASLFSIEPSYIGVSSTHPELEAAGHLVDVLDAHRLMTPSSSGNSTPIQSSLSKLANASHNQKDASSPFTAVIIVNVAPRTESIKKRWGNGPPFCFFAISGVLVVSTYSQLILSLLFRILKRENNASLPQIHVMKTQAVIQHAANQNWIPLDEANRIINTQFRSYEFVPLAAYWIVTRGGSSAIPHDLASILEKEGQDQCEQEHQEEGKRNNQADDKSLNPFIWFIDNFGNCKTSLLPEDIDFMENRIYSVTLENNQSLIIKACGIKRLSDAVPLVPTVLVGSSGYKNYRFLELVIKNDNFSNKTRASIGPFSISLDT
ncbi:hypothetical protein MDAP_002219 [Mitosporidium daphniae]|uniref:Uncharacterized protein n=1 Tax=Mitosporidium daphniae TaxID=1485682 RepID=A0A098VTC9_9MICR|nr:uncharacterized protein DI09_4p390 [Mitosporidium daphniae]KGG50956.1 hypothetical protein DI09_4p390 [Mitosporidium daphniae]|eukprot:XP_013237383.1 uncharacterized protein DI09_4p390 [Mitosporidium daphniae]